EVPSSADRVGVPAQAQSPGDAWPERESETRSEVPGGVREQANETNEHCRHLQHRHDGIGSDAANRDGPAKIPQRSTHRNVDFTFRARPRAMMAAPSHGPARRAAVRTPPMVDSAAAAAGMRGSFRGSTIGFMEPENIRPQNSRSYSCSLTLANLLRSAR